MTRVYCLILALTSLSAAGIDVLTQNYDTMRSGANITETVLTQSNVNSAQFGKLYARNVDGIMYAQPLYASSITIGGGVHNVVYVATMHNSVYAFDADLPNQPAYWQVTMNGTGETSSPNNLLAGSDNNMYPEVGVTSTPVIDKTTNTIYVLAFSKTSTPTYMHRLHALDLSTGAEKFGGPVLISYPGGTVGTATYPAFTSKNQAQRPALLLANGSLYISFASYSDVSTPYWGWTMRYNPSTLAQQYVFNVNPSNTTGKGAGIWESGCGAAVDASGNVYLSTGNGSAVASAYDASTGGVNYAECALKFGPVGLTVSDFYMPSAVASIDSGDADFGGGGHMLLPDQPGSKAHVLAAAGKTGQMFIVDRDNMTHFNANNDASIIQKISLNGGACKGSPVYWQGPSGSYIFCMGEGSSTMTRYAIAVGGNGYIQLTQDKTSATTIRCQHWVLSSNGSMAGTGIIWVWTLDNGNDVIHQTTPIPATLRALNAETLAELYNSGQAANNRDILGGFAKYNSALVANGRVYVPSSADNTAGGQNQLVIYGELADTTPPTISSVFSVNTNTKVTVVFSEPLDPTSAVNIANYGITPGPITISNAAQSADQTTVTLTTSPLAGATTYTLTVNNVKDVALNTILPNSTATFTYQVIPPTVNISAPLGGATFTAPAVFQITAAATAGAGASIAKVDFFVNGNPSGTATAAPFTVTLSNVAQGTYSLTATATDNTNLSTTSSPVSVTVNAGSATYGLNSRAPIAAYLNGQLPPLSSGSIPATLSATGAFSLPFTALTPSTGLIPYNVNTPLWSDNAQKMRWMALPNNGSPYTADQQIGFASTGEWTFPNGTVFVKHFDLPVDDTNPSVTQRLETRFIVRSSDGNVYGVTYKWRADYSDADLEPAAGEDQVYTIKTAGGGTRQQTWHYPSRAECLTCHTTNAGGVLGVKTRQLNGNFTYPSTGIQDNQLRTLNHIGLLNPVIQEASIPGYSKLVAVTDTTATLDNRVRSYIDANCSLCHRPGGTNAYFDARYDTPELAQGLIYGNVRNSLGIAGAKIVVPQNTSRSLLYLRPNAIDATKMPPLAHNVIDTNAVSAIQQWINGLPLDAGASAISINFEDSGNANNIVTGAAGAYTDPSGVVASNWNTCAGVAGANQVLKDNSGTATTATAAWNCNNTWRNGLGNTGGNDSLLKGYLDNTNTGLTTVTVNNIPYSIYNVYVYATGDTVGRTGQYWAKSAASPGGTDPGGKIINIASITTTTLTEATLTSQGNYIVFRCLTNPTCVVTSQAFQYPGGGDGTRAPLNGIQIVDATQSTPTLTGVTPASGLTSGGQRITVIGTNLLPGATFTI
ncbi:MAG TPA: Ig-like domain-containing protein, partial [Planctomycetota bacterium]|nr:Ig-like domain-containing protein [Planctomycetota bacterium]